MDIDKLIGELYAERMRLDAAIAALERAARDGRKRRGRPPKWMARDRNHAPTDAAKPSGQEKGETSQ